MVRQPTALVVTNSAMFKVNDTVFHTGEYSMQVYRATKYRPVSDTTVVGLTG